MSIYDLMSAVREGNFESEFKNCKTTDDKVTLFKKYGVVISLSQYKDIEAKVESIKKGTDLSYDELEDKVEGNNVKDMGEEELDCVAGGKAEEAVFEVLKRMQCSLSVEDNNDHNKDDDVKLWDTKPFLTGRGLF